MARFKVGDVVKDRELNWKAEILGIGPTYYEVNVIVSPKINPSRLEHIDAIDEYCELVNTSIITKLLNKYSR